MTPAFNWGQFADLELPAKNSAKYLHPELGPIERITEVLQIIAKPALLVWAARLEREAMLAALEDGAASPQAVLERMSERLGKAKDGAPKWAHIVARGAAMATGGGAHDALEGFLKGTPVGPLSDEERAAYQAGRAWMVDREVICLGVEKRVYSRGLKIAGTLDLLAELEHEGERIHAVCDWKTSTGHYFEQLAQIAFYGHCLREAGYNEPLWGVVVRLPKNGQAADPRYYSPSHMEQYEAFLTAALILYRAQKDYEQEFKRNGRS